MCGLVGWAGQNSLKNKNMFDFMLFVDTIRGKDSTGIGFLRDDGDIAFVKKAVIASDFLDLKLVDRELGRWNYKAVIGHNRAATKGMVNNVNAHPFICGPILLAHNGTLTNQSLLPNYLDYDVDSENICHAIAEEGIMTTISKLCGAYALTFFNQDDETLNLVRNDKRELSYAYSEDMKTIFWASEQWMLHVGALKAGVKLKEIIKLPIDRLLTISLADYTTKKGLVGKEAWSDVKPYVAPKSAPKSYDYNYNYNPRIDSKERDEKGRWKATTSLPKEIAFKITHTDQTGAGFTTYYGFVSEGHGMGIDKVKVRSDIPGCLWAGSEYTGKPMSKSHRPNLVTLYDIYPDTCAVTLIDCCGEPDEKEA